MRSHVNPVSKMVSIAVKMLKKQSPGLRLIVSYADPEQGHIGGIYQAGNWTYTGVGKSKNGYIKIKGQTYHKKTIYGRYGSAKPSYLKTLGIDAEYVSPADKLKYLMPLDDEMRKQICRLQKPYPKKCGGQIEGRQIPSAVGGASPTPSLHIVYAKTP